MEAQEIAIRLGVAVLFGSLIGFERQWLQRMAGLRTNSLVVVGAAGFAPPVVPPGEHVATITISTRPIPEKWSPVADLPVHDTPWDGSISLRREDMYGD